MKNCNATMPKFQSDQLVARKEEVVIALHCSGGNARQWQGLAQTLEKKYELLAPEHYGTATGKYWSANKMLSLADEAQHSLQLIDQTDKPVHLVGHSYGGALALHIALARPERISSVSLYEPCAFHLLRTMGVTATTELSEINMMAAEIYARMGEGNNWGAMHCFVDYWNGEGAWLGMKPEYRDNLLSWAPNVVNAFDALFAEEISLSEYQSLNVPVQLLVGGDSPDPVRVVSEALSQLLPDSQITRLPGVGHMGPLTHADQVNRIIATHVERASSVIKSRPEAIGSIGKVAAAA